MGWKQEAERYRADDRQVIETGIPKIGYEEPQTMPNGDSLWLRTSKIPLRDAEGRTIAFSAPTKTSRHASGRSGIAAGAGSLQGLDQFDPGQHIFQGSEEPLVCINNAMAKGFGMRSPDEATGKRTSTSSARSTPGRPMRMISAS